MPFLLGFLFGATASPLVLLTLARWRWGAKPDYMKEWNSTERRQMLTKEQEL